MKPATNKYLWPLILITSLFFLWALAHNLNDILIKQFQKALDINRGQAGFIQFAFYLGYFVMAIPAGLLMKKIGLKKVSSPDYYFMPQEPCYFSRLRRLGYMVFFCSRYSSLPLVLPSSKQQQTHILPNLVTRIMQ